MAKLETIKTNTNATQARSVSLRNDMHIRYYQYGGILRLPTPHSMFAGQAKVKFEIN
jgi:hypothetical protein